LGDIFDILGKWWISENIEKRVSGFPRVWFSFLLRDVGFLARMMARWSMNF